MVERILGKAEVKGSIPFGSTIFPLAAGDFRAPRDFHHLFTIPIHIGPVHERIDQMTKFLKLLRNERGATAIEYGLIAALIAVAAITAMTSIGSKLGTTFNNVSNSLT